MAPRTCGRDGCDRGGSRLRLPHVIQARRPVIEGALGEVVSRTRGVTVRRGVSAASLVTGRTVEGVPHVAGVLSSSDEVFQADLVVDAMGRRSPLADMLHAIGARRPVERREQLGFVHYCRQFRTTGRDPAPIALALVDLDGMTMLVVPGDDRTFSVAFCCASDDSELRALRDEQTWERVLALFPDLARARSASEPITPVQVAAAEDRHLAFVHDGRPIATGVVAVGGSAVRTDPSLGRGASIGPAHACVLRDALRKVGAAQPERLVLRFAELGEADVVPLHRRTLAADRARTAAIQADIAEPGVWAAYDGLLPARPHYPGARPTRARVLAEIRAGAVATIHPEHRVRSRSFPHTGGSARDGR